MTRPLQIDQKRIAEIKALMADIDIRTDCTPTLIGAINCVAASGGEPSEAGIKLSILSGRKLIDKEEFLDMALYFAGTKNGNE